MTITSKRIAFFAPIKPPDHPIPSGDRLIAGNLLKALELAGFQAEISSRYICYSKRSATDILEARKEGALEEVDRLLARYSKMAPEQRPDLWLTYHPYCKAPDWIGPRISKALDIPYVTVEAARTAQGINDEWKPWRMEAQAGIRKADRHLCFKPTDRKYLSRLLDGDEKILDFPAFIDTHPGEGISKAILPNNWKPDVPVLVTTGMMRPGKKLKNFELLAEALASLPGFPLNLVIIGGGPEENTIRSRFASLPQENIYWTGQVSHDEVLSWMRAADLFIWPGWKEPIGMVYLEAQLEGLPVIASNSMGVPLVVEHGKTGLLSPEGDSAAMCSNILVMLADRNKRSSMGKAGSIKVQREHSLEAAARRLQEVLADL